MVVLRGNPLFCRRVVELPNRCARVAMDRLLFASLLFLSSWAQAAARIVLLPGASPQTAVAFTAFAPPSQARVVDDSTGAPMPGVRVEYRYNIVGLEPDPPSACVLDDVGLCYASSDGNGFIPLPRFKPIHVGDWGVSMFLEPGRAAATATFSVTAAAPFPQIEVASGAGQRILTGAKGAPFAVRVTRQGQPVAGASVHFVNTSILTVTFVPDVRVVV